jgi:hypothetical protein
MAVPGQSSIPAPTHACTLPSYASPVLYLAPLTPPSLPKPSPSGEQPGPRPPAASRPGRTLTPWQPVSSDGSLSPAEVCGTTSCTPHRRQRRVRLTARAVRGRSSLQTEFPTLALRSSVEARQQGGTGRRPLSSQNRPEVCKAPRTTGLIESEQTPSAETGFIRVLLLLVTRGESRVRARRIHCPGPQLSSTVVALRPAQSQRGAIGRSVEAALQPPAAPPPGRPQPPPAPALPPWSRSASRSGRRRWRCS